MLVSLVIASKNHAPLLQNTLRSIYGQNPPFDLEVIVVNDGSSDDTPKVLDSFPQVTAIHRPLDPTYHNGVWAKNDGLKAAHGEVIIQQSDDVLHCHPDTLKMLVESLSPGAFSVATVYNWEPTTGRIHPRPYVGLDNARPLMFLGACRREEVCSVGGYDEDFATLVWCDDNWFGHGLTHGLKLRCNYLPLTALHQDHQRPQYDWHPAMKLFNEKKAKAEAGGSWMASSGPWPYDAGRSVTEELNRLHNPEVPAMEVPPEAPPVEPVAAEIVVPPQVPNA